MKKLIIAVALFATSCVKVAPYNGVFTMSVRANIQYGSISIRANNTSLLAKIDSTFINGNILLSINNKGKRRTDTTPFSMYYNTTQASKYLDMSIKPYPIADSLEGVILGDLTTNDSRYTLIYK